MCSTHASAECCATLTAVPLARRIQAAEAIRLIQENFLEHLELLPLSSLDYKAALAREASLGPRSGVISNALHVRCAERAGCARIITSHGRGYEEGKKPDGGTVWRPCGSFSSPGFSHRRATPLAPNQRTPAMKRILADFNDRNQTVARFGNAVRDDIKVYRPANKETFDGEPHGAGKVRQARAWRRVPAAATEYYPPRWRRDQDSDAGFARGNARSSFSADKDIHASDVKRPATIVQKAVLFTDGSGND